MNENQRRNSFHTVAVSYPKTVGLGENSITVDDPNDEKILPIELNMFDVNVRDLTHRIKKTYRKAITDTLTEDEALYEFKVTEMKIFNFTDYYEFLISWRIRYEGK